MRKNMKISNPKVFLKEHFGEKCLIMDNVCFNLTSLENFKDQIKELLKDEGFCDLTLVLPVEIDEEDMR